MISIILNKFNDNLGHHTSEKILPALTTCITKACRKGDISARWGGEEFILFLPETPQEQAKLQAERIRQEIETIELILDGNKLLITASLGVAGSYNGMFNHKNLAPDTLESMINHADKALYQAKKQGKNQVHVVNSRKAS